ncbi:hypothetical protein DFH27DRAFT_624015 [Peziza echinospora]|nr:hypothetical protein DFH27DRAFT_624015 [Peziza echinospora]
MASPTDASKESSPVPPAVPWSWTPWQSRAHSGSKSIKKSTNINIKTNTRDIDIDKQKLTPNLKLKLEPSSQYQCLFQIFVLALVGAGVMSGVYRNVYLPTTTTTNKNPPINTNNRPNPNPNSNPTPLSYLKYLTLKFISHTATNWPHLRPTSLLSFYFPGPSTGFFCGYFCFLLLPLLVTSLLGHRYGSFNLEKDGRGRGRDTGQVDIAIPSGATLQATTTNTNTTHPSWAQDLQSQLEKLVKSLLNTQERELAREQILAAADDSIHESCSAMRELIQRMEELQNMVEKQKKTGEGGARKVKKDTDINVNPEQDAQGQSERGGPVLSAAWENESRQLQEELAIMEEQARREDAEAEMRRKGWEARMRREDREDELRRWRREHEVREQRREDELKMWRREDEERASHAGVLTSSPAVV